MKTQNPRLRFRFRFIPLTLTSTLTSTFLALTLALASSAFAQTHTFTGRWTDTADNEEGVRIERCQGPICNNFAEMFFLLGADLVEFTDTVPNPAPGEITYRWRIRYFNSAGTSPYSNIADATTPKVIVVPSAPTNLEVSAISSDALQFSWLDNATDETAQLMRWRSWQPPREGEIFLAANTTGLILEGLKKNTPHCAEVVAVAGEIESAPSNEACAATLKR